MSARSQLFDQILASMYLPALSGFTFDRSRTFRRVVETGTCVEIINLQLGQRSLEGRFTVNLGVFKSGDLAAIPLAKAKEYHCKHVYRTRIGLIIPPRFSLLADIPFLGIFFAPRDRWWKFSDNPEQTTVQMSIVLNLIRTYGLPWLVNTSHIRNNP